MPSAQYCTAKDIKAIAKPAKGSHKGDNGVLLVIGGSKSYFGAPIHALRAASYFVDLCFYSPWSQNNSLANKVKIENADVIVNGDWRKAAARADAILVGPGFEGTMGEAGLVNAVLKLNRSRGKPTILDAPAIWLADKKLFGGNANGASNVAITPHAGEFEKCFKTVATISSCEKMAAKYGGISILLKNHGTDVITDGRKAFINKTGIPAMTKGGTGDVLAGMAAAFACKNPLLQSLKAAAYLNGKAGQELYAKRNSAFTATDLAEEIPFTYKKYA